MRIRISLSLYFLYIFQKTSLWVKNYDESIKIKKVREKHEKHCIRNKTAEQTIR